MPPQETIDRPLAAPAGGSAPRGVATRLSRIALRPELTALVGVVLVFVYFATTAGDSGFLTAGGTRNYLGVAAELGILAAPVALLLIAGEFDLSLGATIGATGIAVSYAITSWGWPLGAALLLGVAVAVVIGLVNGLLVALTRIPSFLVTLATMFVLEGVTLVFTKSVTGQTAISGLSAKIGDDPLFPLFSGQVLGVPVAVPWWIAVTIVCACVLEFTRFGNWIYASGGNAEAARRVGVPVDRVKVVLFIGTATAAALMATLSAITVDEAQVTRGTGLEFQAVVAAVIGGCLITGGFGSPIGAALGALLFGMVSQGFYFTSIDDNWFLAFLGAMLLLAVGVNQYTRARSMRLGTS
jgi:simple sugar transport system permease protein